MKELKKEYALKFFLQSSGHPLEMVICALDSELSGLIDGIENDYALTKAQNGIAINLDQITSVSIKKDYDVNDQTGIQGGESSSEF